MNEYEEEREEEERRQCARRPPVMHGEYRTRCSPKRKVRLEYATGILLFRYRKAKQEKEK
jgi:hypothetical protein